MQRILPSAFSASLLLLCSACRDASGPPPALDASAAPASQPHAAASAPAVPALEVPEIPTASVTAAAVRAHVAKLADDALQGRGAATAGLGLAAEYLEQQLRAAGLAPAFGDRYQQPFELEVGVDIGPNGRLTQGERAFKQGKDFVPFGFSKTGTAAGGLAFVGYGIHAPELSYDDYERVDAKGKVVVFFEGEPGEQDEKSPFDGKRVTRHSSLRGKILKAREAGAGAALVIREKLPKLGALAPESEAGLLSLAITLATAKVLLGFDPGEARAGIDRDYKPRSHAFADRSVELRADVKRRRTINANVAGVLVPEGATTDQAVVLGAHYDHLGMGGAGSLSGVEEPRIHNGADDNASGCAAVLEAARSLAADRAGLRRKVYFVFFAGEESGLLGSQHFTSHSPVPLDQVVTMINLDMVGHLRNRGFDVMGADSAAGLRPVLEGLASGRGLTARFGAGAVGPSDHTSFYTKGVPVTFLFTGAHEHYHRPSDDVDTLNYAGLADMAGVAADLTRALATIGGRPSYVRVEEPKAAASGRGYGPSFGSIPEFGDHTDGVRLSGVRKDSPAEKAGVQGGDTLIEFDGVRIKNLTDFTEVLRGKAAGDEVSVKVRRGDEVLELRAKLERRDR